MGELSHPSLNKLTLNNFMVQKRSLARQAKDHTIKKLVRNSKKLREKKAGNEKQKEKFSRKADKMVEEVLFIKHLHPDEIMKFALLRKKSFASIIKDPKAKIEERALCRLADHKSMNSAVTSLRQQHANWAEEIPLLIKGLGVRHREKRLKRLKQIGKLDTYLEKERKNLKLLQEFTEIDIDPHILQQPQSSAKKQSSRDRKKIREGNVEKESGVGVKRPNIVVAKGSVGDSKENKDIYGNLDVSVTVKERLMGVKSKINSKESLRKKVTLEDGKRSGELVNVKAMAEGTGSDIEYDNWNSGTDDSEESVEDDNVKKDEYTKLQHGKIDCENEGISDEDESESELDNTADQIHDGSDNDSDASLELIANKSGFSMIGKPVNRRKKSQQTDSEVDENSGGEVDAEDAGSCSDSDSDEDVLDYLEKSRVNASSALVTSRSQRTAVVQQLDLQKISGGTIEKVSTNEAPCGDSDDEDYFTEKIKGREVKTEKRVKKRGSNFFLGVVNGGAEDGDEDCGDESEEEGEKEIGLDTGKYFRRNMFREKDNQGFGGKGRGRGRGRGQGGGRGHEDTWRGGRGRGKGRGRGGREQRDTGREERGKWESEKEGDWNFKEKFMEEENGQSGSRGRGRGGSRGGDGHGQWRGGDGHGQWRGGDRRGQGQGRGQWRGGDRRGWERSGDRRGSYDRGGQRRGGFGGKFQCDFGSANLIPLSKRSSDVSEKSTKDEKPSGSLLHPSWLAKQRELQTAAINGFQGKHMVFDD